MTRAGSSSSTKASQASRDKILFYDKDAPFYQFTNFYPSPVLIDGKVWPSTEHYFQAQKFVGTPYQEAIRQIPTAREAFQLSRDPSVSKWCRGDWSMVKDDVMLKALRCKFNSPKLKKMLLETGNKRLMEHTRNDLYWGDGGIDGRGENQLGKLLEQVRDELRFPTLSGTEPRQLSNTASTVWHQPSSSNLSAKKGSFATSNGPPTKRQPLSTYQCDISLSKTSKQDVSSKGKMEDYNSSLLTHDSTTVPSVSQGSGASQYDLQAAVLKESCNGTGGVETHQVLSTGKKSTFEQSLSSSTVYRNNSRSKHGINQSSTFNTSIAAKAPTRVPSGNFGANPSTLHKTGQVSSASQFDQEAQATRLNASFSRKQGKEHPPASSAGRRPSPEKPSSLGGSNSRPKSDIKTFNDYPAVNGNKTARAASVIPSRTRATSSSTVHSNNSRPKHGLNQSSAFSTSIAAKALARVPPGNFGANVTAHKLTPSTLHKTGQVSQFDQEAQATRLDASFSRTQGKEHHPASSAGRRPSPEKPSSLGGSNSRPKSDIKTSNHYPAVNGNTTARAASGIPSRTPNASDTSCKPTSGNRTLLSKPQVSCASQVGQQATIPKASYYRTRGIEHHPGSSAGRKPSPEKSSSSCTGHDYSKPKHDTKTSNPYAALNGSTGATDRIPYGFSAANTTAFKHTFNSFQHHNRVLNKDREGNTKPLGPPSITPTTSTGEDFAIRRRANDSSVKYDILSGIEHPHASTSH